MMLHSEAAHRPVFQLAISHMVSRHSALSERHVAHCEHHVALFKFQPTQAIFIKP